MKKKIILSLLCAFGALTANSQNIYQDRPPFGEGKFYVATSMSGFDLNYSGNEKWKMDIGAKAGYLFEDNLMILAKAEFDYRKKADNAFIAGAGLRYYFEDNGLYFGAGASYVHKYHSYDDFMPSAHFGYSFFLNRTVTLEPEVYYNQSLKDHSEYSGFGVRIGLGIYFE
jgi:hypothetical protein